MSSPNPHHHSMADLSAHVTEMSLNLHFDGEEEEQEEQQRGESSEEVEASMITSSQRSISFPSSSFASKSMVSMMSRREAFVLEEEESYRELPQLQAEDFVSPLHSSSTSRIESVPEEDRSVELHSNSTSRIQIMDESERSSSIKPKQQPTGLQVDAVDNSSQVTMSTPNLNLAMSVIVRRTPRSPPKTARRHSLPRPPSFSHRNSVQTARPRSTSSGLSRRGSSSSLLSAATTAQHTTPFFSLKSSKSTRMSQSCRNLLSQDFPTTNSRPGCASGGQKSSRCSIPRGATTTSSSPSCNNNSRNASAKQTKQMQRSSSMQAYYFQRAPRPTGYGIGIQGAHIAPSEKPKKPERRTVSARRRSLPPSKATSFRANISYANVAPVVKIKRTGKKKKSRNARSVPPIPRSPSESMEKIRVSREALVALGYGY